LLQAAIHKHTNALMGRRSSNTPLEPASTEAILNYKSTLKDEDGPSLDQFQADFSEKSPDHSTWNRQLCDIFVEDYVKKGLPISEVKKLPDFFMMYLESLQSASQKMTATAEKAQVYQKASH